MQQWSEIRRRVLVDGESKRSIQREFGIHWETLEKILAHEEPPGYRMSRPRRKRKLEEFLPTIDAILRGDGEAPAKQRHTAKRIFDRLRDEHGYTGGLTVVKDAVRVWRQQHAEVFIPLRHPPGEAQCDFGQATVLVDGEAVKVALFVMTLPYSDAIFCCVFPRECTETFQEGHRRAFAFFGGVPKRISYDNTKIAVKKVVGARQRELTDEFLRLQSHYLFAAHFCHVGRANEKGHVENLLGFARRNFLVPVPHTERLETLNGELKADCRRDLERSVRGKDVAKARLLAEERASLLPVPATAFEARRVETPTANSLSLARFDGNDYSVPTAYAHHSLTAVGTLDEVRILSGDQVVATHARRWDRHRIRFDPIHYLAALEKKPGAFDVARPLEGWNLPECFALLRRRLENQWEDVGTREFIRVLRLLESVPLSELAEAVRYALSIGVEDADAIRLVVEHRRQKPVGLFCLDGRPHLKQVEVQTPDPVAYGSLLAGGVA